MLKLLAFDLDDTLYSERIYIQEGFKLVSAYMRKSHGIDAKEFYKKLASAKKLTPSGKIFDIVLQNYQLDKKLVKKLIEEYRSQSLRIRLYPGVRSTLKALSKKYALAVVTDGKKVVQYRKLKHLKITKYFDTILYTLDLGKNFAKPSDLAFRQLLKAHKLKPQEALYIGNNPDKDFIGAKKIGMRTVRINQGVYKGITTDKLTDADFTIKNIKDLPSLISSLEK